MSSQRRMKAYTAHKACRLSSRQNQKPVVEILGRERVILRQTEYATVSCDSVGANCGAGCARVLIVVFPQRRPRHQREFARFRNRRAPSRARRNPWRSMAFRISCPPRLNSSISSASSRSTLLDQRQATLEPIAGPLDFKVHHLAELRTCSRWPRCRFADAEAAKILQRQINASLARSRR